MFEIEPSIEFSVWFEALSPELAEEVACALELLAEAGVALGPSRTSRALLWYDGGGAAPLNTPLVQSPISERQLHWCDQVRELLLWRREVVSCLESVAFRERLQQLEPKAASVALLAVENLRARLRIADQRIALRGPLPSLVFSAEDPLKEAFFQVLGLVGLEPAQIMNAASGLGELTIPSAEPPLRILFGLDAPGQRLVALLGEPLTRTYYGDSVKLAEQRWLQYCASASTSTSTTTTTP